MFGLPHPRGGGADELIAQQQQGRKHEDNGYHTDDGTPGHEHAHRADDVDLGVNRHADGCRKPAHAGHDHRGDGGGKRRVHWGSCGYGASLRPLMIAR